MTTCITPSDRLRRQLFVACAVALVSNAVGFAVRADIMDALGAQFHLSQQQVGWMAGAAFSGFTISVLLGGPGCDGLGVGRVLGLAFVLQVVGILATIASGGFWPLFWATFVVGLGNGLVGAAVNPLVATLYAGQKTAGLNALHAWFPGGVALGGLAALLFTHLGLGWQAKMALGLVPVALYAVLFAGKPIPHTERVQSGVSTREMFRELLRPAFLSWLAVMLLTASTELGPNQWAASIMRARLPVGSAGAGILVLVWMNAVMMGGRLWGARLSRRLVPTSVLMGAAVLSAAGLLWLSAAGSTVPAFAAAGIYSLGVCLFWPNMLGVTSERFPKGGALLLAAMGAAGNFSSQIVLPAMGAIRDRAVAATGDPALAGALALRAVALLPAILLLIFAGVHLWFRAHGGYRVVRL